MECLSDFHYFSQKWKFFKKKLNFVPKKYKKRKKNINPKSQILSLKNNWKASAVSDKLSDYWRIKIAKKSNFGRKLHVNMISIFSENWLEEQSSSQERRVESVKRLHWEQPKMEQILWWLQKPLIHIPNFPEQFIRQLKKVSLSILNCFKRSFNLNWLKF